MTKKLTPFTFEDLKPFDTDEDGNLHYNGERVIVLDPHSIGYIQGKILILEQTMALLLDELKRSGVPALAGVNLQIAIEIARRAMDENEEIKTEITGDWVRKLGHDADEFAKGVNHGIDDAREIIFGPTNS